jgi:hypothetical protein
MYCIVVCNKAYSASMPNYGVALLPLLFTFQGANRVDRNARCVKLLEVRVSFYDFAAMQICGQTAN